MVTAKWSFVWLLPLFCSFFFKHTALAQGETCATAVAVSPGTYTADGPATGNGAANICFTNATHADWYSYTPTSDGTIDISACNGGADTRLSVYTGSCGSLTCHASNDDACDLGNGMMYASELTNISVTANTTYYIEWDDGWEPNGFTWTLTFTPPSACPAPSSQMESNITSSSADLDWTENGSATVWDIEWGSAGFVQGTGTMVTGLTAKPYTLNGLSSGTSYDWYVRSDCSGSGNGLSNWTGPHTFTTLCSGTTAVPYSNDFETSAACWTTQDRNGDGASWALGPGSDCSIQGFVASTIDNNTPMDEWLFSPSFALTAGTDYLVQFKTRPEFYPGTARLEVFLMDAADPAAANKMLLFKDESFPTLNFCYSANSTVTAPTAWSAYYIGFHAYSGNSDVGVIVDDFKIEETPPVSGIQIQDINTPSNTCNTYQIPGIAGNGWHHIYHYHNGEPIVLSLNSHGQVLQTVNLDIKDFTSVITLTDASTGNSKKLMSRVCELTSDVALTAPVSVRLYQLNQELTDMNNSPAGSGVSNFTASDLEITHYYCTGNSSCGVADNQANGTCTDKISSANITTDNTANGFYLEFTLNPMIEFFAHEPSVGPLSNGTFPIELSSFEAYAEGSYNVVKWSTALEINNAWMVVERSADGLELWEEIGRVAGQLYSLEERHYEIQDKNPLPVSYYRLRSIDVDGQQDFSPLRVVLRENLPQGRVFIHSNPTIDRLSISLSSLNRTSVELEILSLSGVLLGRQTLLLDKGTTPWEWSLGFLPAGMYVLRVLGEYDSQSLLFVKQ